MSIIIYTDGSAKGNPGKGGYGVVMLSGKHRKEISKGFLLTTNNRMELLAVIVGIENVKKLNSEIVVYSDSKYVVDSAAINVDNFSMDSVSIRGKDEKVDIYTINDASQIFA